MRIYIEKTSKTDGIQLFLLLLVCMFCCSSIVSLQNSTILLLNATTVQGEFLVHLKNHDEELRNNRVETVDTFDFREDYILSSDVLRNAPPDFKKRGIDVFKEYQIHVDCNKTNVTPPHTAEIENHQTVYHFYSQKCSEECQKPTSPVESLRKQFSDNDFTLSTTDGQKISVHIWKIVQICNFESMSTTASTKTENEPVELVGRENENRPKIEKRAVKPERILTDIKKEARYPFLKPRKTTAIRCPPHIEEREYTLTTKDEETKPEEQPTTAKKPFKISLIIVVLIILYVMLVSMVGWLIYTCMARRHLEKVRALLRETNYQES